MDVQGWHLYLKDASAGKGLKIAQALAQQLGSEMSQGKFQPQELEGILKKVRGPLLAASSGGDDPEVCNAVPAHQQHALKPQLNNIILTTLPPRAGACLTRRWQGDVVSF